MTKLLDLPTEILEHVISYIRPPRQATSLEEVQALFRLRTVHSTLSRHLSPAVILSSIEIRLSDQGRIESESVIQRLASSGLCAAITFLSILDDIDAKKFEHLEGYDEILGLLRNKYGVNKATEALLQQCSTTLRHLCIIGQHLTYFDWAFKPLAWTLTHLAASVHQYVYFSNNLWNLPTLTALAILSGTGEAVTSSSLGLWLPEISSARVSKHITYLYVEQAGHAPMLDILRILPIQPVHLALTVYSGEKVQIIDVLRTAATSTHVSKRLAELSIAGVPDASEVKGSMALPEELPASVKVQLLEDPIGNRPFWVQV